MSFSSQEFVAFSDYVNRLRAKATIPPQRDLPISTDYTHDSVFQLAMLIAVEPVINMNFTKMIDEVPLYYAEKDAQGNYIHGYYLSSIEEMLGIMDVALSEAPEYNETGLVGFPINTILNWSMGTPSGTAAFNDDRVNKAIKAILNEWGAFLESPASLGTAGNTVFNNVDGWCSAAANEKIHMDWFLTGDDLINFSNGYDGVSPFPYASWNDFFIRVFHDWALRPFDATANVLCSPCESQVFDIRKDCKLEDWFWVKSQPYSLQHLIGFPPNLANEIEYLNHYNDFIGFYDGGTVHQAFLSATKYHRWNSPLTGTIIKAYNIDGTYYASTFAAGMDPSSPDLSQGYIAHTAARAVIVFDTVEFGQVTFIGIGMSEVSSCIVDEDIMAALELGPVAISKGDEIGRFQYGGSTSCLIFEKAIADKMTWSSEVGKSLLVGESIATVTP